MADVEMAARQEGNDGGNPGNRNNGKDHWERHDVIFFRNDIKEDIFGPVNDQFLNAQDISFRFGPELDDTCLRSMQVFRTGAFAQSFHSPYRPAVHKNVANHAATHPVPQLDVRIGIAASKNGVAERFFLYSCIAGTDTDVDLVEAAKCDPDFYITPGLFTLPRHEYFNPHGGKSSNWLDMPVEYHGGKEQFVTHYCNKIDGGFAWEPLDHARETRLRNCRFPPPFPSQSDLELVNAAIRRYQRTPQSSPAQDWTQIAVIRDGEWNISRFYGHCTNDLAPTTAPHKRRAPWAVARQD